MKRDKSEEENWEKLKAKHSEWNKNAHPEDKISFNEWLDERIGDVIYGYRIVKKESGTIKLERFKK